MTIGMKTVIKRVGAAMAVGLVVFVAVLVVLLTRPTAYDARISLLATPSSSSSSSSDFGSVVALGLPAAVDVAHSPSVLNRASRAVPGAPDGDALSGAVTVELVPASGLVRVTVRADSDAVASGVAASVAQQISSANLLAPSATLRIIDTEAQITQVAPDAAYSGGIAIVAGALGAAIVYGLMVLIRPSVRALVHRALVRSKIEGSVAVVEMGGSEGVPDELILLAESAGRPVRVIAADARSRDEADKLRNDLTEASITMTDDADGPTMAVVGKPVDTVQLVASINVLPENAELLAVVVR